ncbi:MAG TPA: ATP-binding protein [Pseudomonadales bacterium]|nr:ATP-binding protein [Pseudomonadales bacterium]
MRVGLTARVVLTIVSVAVAVVILDTALTRWAFQHRFLTYVQAQEAEVLDRLATRLGAVYETTGDWGAMDLRRELRGIGAELRAGSEHRRPREPFAAAADAGREAPPDRLRHRGEQDDGGADAGPAFDGRSSLHRLRSMLGRLRLTDAAGAVLFAPPRGMPPGAETTDVPVRAGDRVVGTLQLLPAPALSREPDLRFARELTRLIWLIAAAAALLAGAVGWWLARRLLAPVSAVAEGARQLAEGRYDLRLEDARSDELGALARDFNRLASALEAARDARQRWLADVAHELRTPLSVLRAEIDALRDGVRPVDATALDSLAAEMVRLSRLVDDLHQLSLADAGALDYHMRRTDLVDQVRACAGRFETRIADAGLALECTLPDRALVAEIDPDRFDQMLGNLLENALRYTDAPGTVRLTLTGSADRVQLSVDDSAPGVAEADRERLFERFTRLDASRSRETGGAGLGLAIVRRIAEAHGGDVAADASPLGGVRIRVDLPLAQGDPEP